MKGHSSIRNTVVFEESMIIDHFELESQHTGIFDVILVFEIFEDNLAAQSKCWGIVGRASARLEYKNELLGTPVLIDKISSVHEVFVYPPDLGESCTRTLQVMKIKCPRNLLTVVFYLGS